LSKIAISGNPSGTGTFTIASPNSDVDRTFSLPDASGTVATTADISAATSATDVQTFDTSGTWTKPSSGSMARIQVWGGGGGGARNGSAVGNGSSGGGGGGYNEVTVPLSILGSSVSITIGAGGTGRTGSTGDGNEGGSSQFGTLIGASGGSGGITLSSSVSGGVPFKAETTTPINSGTGIFSGGDSNRATSGGGSVFGGGGGGGSGTNLTTTNTGGISGYAGDGGEGGASPSFLNGYAPSGGGGGRNNNLDGGNGADGRVIVTVW
jgi:hypothetical protein